MTCDVNPCVAQQLLQKERIGRGEICSGESPIELTIV